ncbi:hypothetical protein SAMN02745126_03623 [Enhydrobacter aerosaccus]|uniref:Uncharacterized protein n=1 Tax=Enhydrobacter aerosaccus TaxID=225324 RepID=A0A1T4R6H7_9HYPH|nr:hypothetical protein SAMN02745126_03623 [Enhydrobacter aerosaccus]
MALAGVQVVGVLGFVGLLSAARVAPDIAPLLQMLAFLWFFVAGALWLALPSLLRRRRQMHLMASRPPQSSSRPSRRS